MIEEIIEGYRLSPQQRHLWQWMHRASPDAFRSAFVLTVLGGVDSTRLRRAWHQAVGRHEALRTTFRGVAGLEFPLQIITSTDEQTASMDGYVEVECGAACTRKDESCATADQEWRRLRNGMDAEAGPVWRVRVVQCTAERWELMACASGLCADGRTLLNVADEWARCYHANTFDVEVSDAPVQYVQYSEWQHEVLDSEEAGRAQARWDATSGGSVLRLPHEQAVEKTGEYAPVQVPVEVKAELGNKLRAVAAGLGARLSDVVEAGWRVLLWRLSGEAEVTLARCFDGRTYEELGQAFGLFQKYIPVHTRLAGNLRFHEVLERVRKAVSDVSEWQDYFVGDAVKDETVVEDSSRIGFDFASWESPPHADGLEFSLTQLESYTERFKLRLTATDADGTLRVQLHYDPAFYIAETVARLAEGLSAVLLSVGRNPRALVSELEVLGERERRRMLVEWNCSAIEFPRGECVHDLFEAQAARTPDVTALTHEGDQLTYEELNRQANQLAHHLRSLGVAPEIRVGLLLERSMEMLIALFGVLKAGGAYVPLDPEYPGERLNFMLADAGIEVLLTRRELVETVRGFTGQVICLDTERDEIGRRSEENPRSEATGENLAYVIYTSGSTGRPKGVMIEHHSVVNLARALSHTVYAGLGASLRISLNAPLVFDASVKQVVQLLRGHTLCVIPENVRLDSAAVLSYLSEQRVDVMDCTPSQLRWLQAEGLGERTDLALSTMLVGGEAIEVALWQRLSESRRINYYNVYGPTECTVDAALCEVGGPGVAARPNIGRPLANVRLYVLDRGGRLLPTGVVGEIYIGGEGVGRGYVNGAELTAARFVPDGFSSEPGARLYATGDLGSHLEDGSIEYRGRIDRQVKVRGYRIELGEIESALEAHEGVKECAVEVRESERGDRRLVAYVVAPDGQGSNGAGRSGYRLPNGMVVAQQNRNETDNLYQEIFKDRVYLKYGIRLAAGACVMDVGANIGLFTLFVTQNCADARIYAFEPLQPVYEKLAINAARYSAATKVFAYGLSDREKIESFAYYPRYTAKSGVSAYADAADEVEVVKTFLRNQQQHGVREAGSLIEVEDELLSHLFESESHECSLKRLSDVIRAEGIEQIDLLKVDVQRAELDVLKGVDAADWPKIQQLVMEVHDGQQKATGGRLGEITGMLEGRGFEVLVEQDEYLVGTDRYNLYAARHRLHRDEQASGNGGEEYRNLDIRPPREEDLTPGELQQFLRKRVPEYMVPAAWVMLDQMPLTRHGKIDRQALPAPEDVQRRSRAELAKPGTPAEEIVVAVWAEVLGVNEIGLNDNFFELGGHSLMATQVVSRLREAFGIELPLRTFFREPTAAGLAANIDAALRSDLGVSAPLLLPAARGEGELPLSFAQQRLWFLHQWEASSPFYNSPIALRLEGRLEVPVLQRTLNEIVRRHEALRTTFVNLEGAPAQRIQARLRVGLPVVDLSALAEDGRERAVRSLAGQEARRPFDLSVGPLLRVTLLRLGVEQHVTLFTMHHIVSDGWSMSVLVKEVAALYPAFSEGRPSPLAELPIQYADYAVWQREYLQGEVLERQLDYWRKQMAGALALLTLPTDRPRPRVQTYRGASHQFELDAELAAGLRALSRREGVTLFMTLLACWQTLLWRYTGQDEVSVGTAIANRQRRETEELIGFFVNTLVLRTDFSGEPRFTELLRRVREVCLGAYAHQDLPFERLVEELRPERSLSHSPLFQVMFVLHNEPSSELELSGLRLSAAGSDHSPAKFDLRLSLSEIAAGGSLGGVLTFNADLFDAETASRMTTHFRRLLQAIVADSSCRLSDLPLLTPVEERQLLSEWTGARADFGPTACLHELFERQTEIKPKDVAVVSEGERLTYAELNRRANQLAHGLRSLGVGPDVCVGLLLEPSAETAVAVLGIFKAGGAYVGLDPHWPANRLAFALADAGALALVTDSALLSRSGLKELWEAGRNEAVAGKLLPCRLLCLDEEGESLAALPSTNPEPVARPENLAYLIYTSGSTGAPKAVMIEHRQVVNYVRAASERLGLRDGSYAVQQSLAVDAPVTYLFAALSLGGELHLLGRELAGDAERLGNYLQRENIDYFKIAPSHLAALLAETQPEATLPRRLLLVGGEALGRGLAEKVLMLGNCAVVNHYGPTETTVGVLTHHVQPCVREAETADRGVRIGTDISGEGRGASAATGSVVSLGRPLPNTRVYILDRWMRPSPVGSRGEIYVGGEGVARGYLNRPEMTAERFVPDPFGEEAGARLYRTGDLGWWRAGGEVEFLGRIDHQVKVRGFRVEVEEVETELEAHPGVRSAVVEARSDTRGEMRLVCYLVWAGSATGATDRVRETVAAKAGSIDVLRRWALGRLPDYMVPTAWIELTELPRTPQGKVDRRVLPDPDWAVSATSAGYVEPVEELERQVAGVFERVLGIDRVGIGDDFFELGGHSLLATRAVSQLRRELKVEISLRELFEHPSVGELSTTLRDRLQVAVQGGTNIVEIARAGREGRRVQSAVLEEEEMSV